MRVRGNRWASVPPPQPDELMSSWLHRLARANGRSDHTLCSMMFGPVPLLTRDLDLTMPVALLPVLSEWTGISEHRLSELLLTTLQGKVTGESRTGTGCRWVLPLGVYHRVRRHHGLQYCPQCLAEPIAYARKQWRYAFVTECLEHERPLFDRCPTCASPFMFHRMHPDRGQRWGCATCGEALNTPDASAGSKYLLRRQQARLVAAAGSGGARMNCRWVNSLTLFNGYRFLVHTLTSSRLKHLANTAIIDRDGTLRPSGTHTEFERMGVYLRRPIMLALATWMTDWPDRFLRDVRSSCSSRSVLMGDRRHIPFWIQEVLDTLPTAQPHRLTSQEVQSCARWLRAGGQAISFDGLCRALSLSTWERMLPANRVLLGEGVSALD